MSNTEKPKQTSSVELTDATQGPWNLGELTQVTQRELERRKIPNPGGRVSQVPSARTIRYYTSLGLVDRPLGYDGGVAQYGPRHLLQLLSIKVLQAEYLPLPEIQKHLYGRSEDELREIIESATQSEEETRRTAPTKVETWLTMEAVPGLRMIVENRQALLEWVRNHTGEDARDRLLTAFTSLTEPGSRGER